MVRRAADVDLMRSGAELVIPGDEIIARTAVHGAELTGEREWGAIRRSIERTDPSYRD